MPQLRGRTSYRKEERFILTKLLVHFSPIHAMMDQTETMTMINDTEKMFLASVVTHFQSPIQLPASILWKILFFAAFPRVK